MAITKRLQGWKIQHQIDVTDKDQNSEIIFLPIYYTSIVKSLSDDGYPEVVLLCKYTILNYTIQMLKIKLFYLASQNRCT